jgi:hypothetical protein
VGSGDLLSLPCYYSLIPFELNNGEFGSEVDLQIKFCFDFNIDINHFVNLNHRPFSLERERLCHKLNTLQNKGKTYIKNFLQDEAWKHPIMLPRNKRDKRETKVTCSPSIQAKNPKKLRSFFHIFSKQNNNNK